MTLNFPGAHYDDNQDVCRFRVWAPFAGMVELHIVRPVDRVYAMNKAKDGYYETFLPEIRPGARYFFRLDGNREFPDPASRSQPLGVHGPSEVICDDFPWEDENWNGHILKDYIIYELHVGTFSEAGTFDGVADKLNELTDLGVTAVEIMPTASFPGERNWGYDGVYPFAVHHGYGGHKGFKRLVNECHKKGLAVILDVVYNHLGPEGNYLAQFGPYFTSSYKTPWGDAVNFDGAHNHHVRDYFIGNALQWVTDFHVDALRLDAIHGIFDVSPVTFLEELSRRVKEAAKILNRNVYIIAESDRNDRKTIISRQLGGVGLDAVWNDDFHHALHTLLTNEKTGYYVDFGELRDLIKAFSEGFVYSGQYSRFRMRPHGTSSKDISPEKFVVFSQNHDQVGNRMFGERLSRLVSREQLKLAAGAVILSPFIPLLFMGEEYASPSPFPYFVDHSDSGLLDAIKQGRRDEFRDFKWAGTPADPGDEQTFLSAKTDSQIRFTEFHRTMYEFYKKLISLRKSFPSLGVCEKNDMEVSGFEDRRLIRIIRRSEKEITAGIFNFGNDPVFANLPLPGGVWIKLFDSADTQWMGPGSTCPSAVESNGEAAVGCAPHSFLILKKEGS